MVILSQIMWTKTIISFFNTPRKWSLGGILFSPCPSIYPSICLSVRLSLCPPSVDMILSTHILRDGCIDFSENVYTYYSLSEDVHLEFSYWLDKFSSFYRLFSVFGLGLFFFIKRNSVLKIMRNFDSNIENVLFVNCNFVFTIMINNIVKELW